MPAGQPQRTMRASAEYWLALDRVTAEERHHSWAETTRFLVDCAIAQRNAQVTQNPRRGWRIGWPD